MNANITQFLFTYMDNPDPRYAVMLKGKWGCGKSFSIDGKRLSQPQKGLNILKMSDGTTRKVVK